MPREGGFSMIHIFNRRELITTLSEQQLYRIQSALSAAGIPYHTKANHPFFTADRYRGTPFINHDAANPMVIYVKAVDYDRAKKEIATVMQNGNQ